MKVFDSHCHLGRFGTIKYKGYQSEPFAGFEVNDYRQQLAYMSANKLQYSLVVPHYTQDPKQPFAVFNPLIKQATEQSEHIFGGYWVSPLAAHSELTNQVLKSLPQPKIVALKISPSAWPNNLTLNPTTWNSAVRANFQAIISALQKHALVLHVHTGSGQADASHLDNFVAQYGKGIKIQFVHMGGSMSGHLSFVPRFIEWINQGYDFYTDTSNSRGFALKWINNLAKKNPKIFKHILFASDNPWGDLQSELIKIQQLSCSLSIKQAILFKNAYALYVRD